MRSPRLAVTVMGLPLPTAMLADALSESSCAERVFVIRMLSSENE